MFTGNFSDGKRHGKGEFLYANGSRYKGLWENDMKSDPEAIFVTPQGILYKDGFVNDRPTKFIKREDGLQIQLCNIYDEIDQTYLNEIMLRQNDNLRSLYRKYTQAGTTRMTMKDFWRLCSDYGLRDFSTAVADRLCCEVPATLFPDTYLDIHNEEGALEVRELANFLFRAADLLITEDLTRTEKFLKLMTRMAEKAEDTASKKDFWLEDKTAEKVREMDLSLSRFLTRPRNLSFSGKAIIDRTCTLRALLQGLKRLMPDGTPAYDQSKVLSDFCEWIEIETEKKDQAWDIELIEAELCNALVIVAGSFIKLPEKETEEDQQLEDENEEPSEPTTLYYPVEEGLDMLEVFLK